MSNHRNAIVESDEISKSFGSIQVLDSVPFDVKENEALAVMGGNGAGKSTLMKILSGILQQTSGQLRVHGEDVHFENHIDAREAGIETIYQDLALAPHRPIWANIFLGKGLIVDGPLGGVFGFLEDEYMRWESKKVLDRLEMSIDPDNMVKITRAASSRQSWSTVRSNRTPKSSSWMSRRVPSPSRPHSGFSTSSKTSDSRGSW